MTRRRARDGIVLILLAGLLTLLGVTASILVRLTGSTRGVSRAYVEDARARLLSRSGLEAGWSRLARAPDPPRPASRRNQADDWTYREAPSVSLEAAANPSYCAGEPYGDTDADGRYTPPDTFSAADDRDDSGRREAFSGRLRGPHGRFGSVYALRIDDESSKIDANGGFLDAGNRDADALPDHRDADVRPAPSDPKDTGLGWNAQLTRVLGILGAQPEVGVPSLGALVLANRPVGGYLSIEDLARRTGIARDLSPYVTVHGRPDPNVVHPNAYPIDGAVPGIALPTHILKWRRFPLSREPGGRPPVNLNAASRPVLAALLDGLSGVTWHDNYNPRIATLTAAQAAAVADAIVVARAADPFDTWGEFFRFCDGLVDAGTLQGFPLTDEPGCGNQIGADLLKANFDPNTRLAKQMPGPTRYAWIDKSDLHVWSTEGTLGPSGIFRIDSLGTLRGPNGVAVAAARTTATREIFRTVHHTTQADFVAGRRPDLTATSYLSLAPVGTRTDGAGAAWNTWAAGRGLAAVTHPCPMPALPAGASGIDGHVSLATIEQPHLPVAGLPLTFLHHFDDSWDADVGAARALVPAMPGSQIQTVLSTDIWPPPSPSRANSILPDGAHCQRNQCPSFQARGNLPPYVGSNRAVISYWIKEPAAWGANIFEGRRTHLSCSRVPFPYQFLATGSDRDGAGICYENSLFGDDLQREDVRWASLDRAARRLRVPGMNWQLLTVAYDTAASSKILSGISILGESRGTIEDTSGSPSYGGLPMIDGSLNEDIAPDNTVTFTLGIGNANNVNFQGHCNQVIDEFAIFDPGADEAAARPLVRQLHDDRFADGRYDKGIDARYVSPILEPSPGSAVRIVQMRWTVHLPNDVRRENVLAIQVSIDIATVPPAGTPRAADARLTRSRVEFDLLNDTGAVVLASGVRHGARLDIPRNRFRYRARFLPDPIDPATGLPDPLNQPVLETPVLDDVTILYVPPGPPRLLAWGG